MFDRAAKTSSVIQSHFVDNAGSRTIHVKAGYDILQSIRNDRKSGSKVHSILNNDPFSSDRRMQLISIVRKYESYVEGSADLPRRIFKERQLVASYMHFTLRMNPRDITELLE